MSRADDDGPSLLTMLKRHALRIIPPFVVTFAGAALIIALLRVAGLDGRAYDGVVGGVVIIAAIVVSIWIATRDLGED